MLVEQARCPSCGTVGSMRIDQALQARPVGSFSLAGYMTKFTAQSVPILRCRECPLEVTGRYDGERHAVFPTPQ